MSKKRLRILSLITITLTTILWARWRPAERLEIKNLDSKNFRIMTWNVGYFALSSNKNMKDVDIPELIRVMKSCQADVVVLQEIAKVEQAEKVATALGENWRAYSVKTGHGEQTLSVITDLTLIAEENIACASRMAKGLSLRDESGKSIYVLGLHSPHPAHGFQDTTESINTAIKHTRKRHEEVRLIAGDLNYNFDINSSNELYDNILSDFGDGTVELGETYYAHTRIDHVFHYPKSLNAIKDESGILDLKLRFAQVPGFRDHRPIIVSYDLQNLNSLENLSSL